MGGGLLQLAASGIQDIIFINNPQITYFKTVFRRYSNFNNDHQYLEFNGLVNFNKKTSCRIQKNGDLVGKMYLCITLPEILVKYRNSVSERIIDLLAECNIIVLETDLIITTEQLCNIINKYYSNIKDAFEDENNDLINLKLITLANIDEMRDELVSINCGNIVYINFIGLEIDNLIGCINEIFDESEDKNIILGLIGIKMNILCERMKFLPFAMRFIIVYESTEKITECIDIAKSNIDRVFDTYSDKSIIHTQTLIITNEMLNIIIQCLIPNSPLIETINNESTNLINNINNIFDSSNNLVYILDQICDLFMEFNIFIEDSDKIKINAVEQIVVDEICRLYKILIVYEQVLLDIEERCDELLELTPEEFYYQIVKIIIKPNVNLEKVYCFLLQMLENDSEKLTNIQELFTRIKNVLFKYIFRKTLFEDTKIIDNIAYPSMKAEDILNKFRFIDGATIEYNIELLLCNISYNYLVIENDGNTLIGDIIVGSNGVWNKTNYDEDNFGDIFLFYYLDLKKYTIITIPNIVLVNFFTFKVNIDGILYTYRLEIDNNNNINIYNVLNDVIIEIKDGVGAIMTDEFDNNNLGDNFMLLQSNNCYSPVEFYSNTNSVQSNMYFLDAITQILDPNTISNSTFSVNKIVVDGLKAYYPSKSSYQFLEAYKVIERILEVDFSVNLDNKQTEYVRRIIEGLNYSFNMIRNIYQSFCTTNLITDKRYDIGLGNFWSEYTGIPDNSINIGNVEYFKIINEKYSNNTSVFFDNTWATFNIKLEDIGEDVQDPPNPINSDTIANLQTYNVYYKYVKYSWNEVVTRIDMFYNQIINEYVIGANNSKQNIQIISDVIPIYNERWNEPGTQIKVKENYYYVNRIYLLIVDIYAQYMEVFIKSVIDQYTIILDTVVNPILPYENGDFYIDASGNSEFCKTIDNITWNCYMLTEKNKPTLTDQGSLPFVLDIFYKYDDFIEKILFEIRTIFFAEYDYPVYNENDGTRAHWVYEHRINTDNSLFQGRFSSLSILEYYRQQIFSADIETILGYTLVDGNVVQISNGSIYNGTFATYSNVYDDEINQVINATKLGLNQHLIDHDIYLCGLIETRRQQFANNKTADYVLKVVLNQVPPTLEPVPMGTLKVSRENVEIVHDYSYKTYWVDTSTIENVYYAQCQAQMVVSLEVAYDEQFKWFYNIILDENVLLNYVGENILETRNVAKSCLIKDVNLGSNPNSAIQYLNVEKNVMQTLINKYIRYKDRYDVNLNTYLIENQWFGCLDKELSINITKYYNKRADLKEIFNKLINQKYLSIIGDDGVKETYLKLYINSDPETIFNEIFLPRTEMYRIIVSVLSTELNKYATVEDYFGYKSFVQDTNEFGNFLFIDQSTRRTVYKTDVNSYYLTFKNDNTKYYIIQGFNAFFDGDIEILLDAPAENGYNMVNEDNELLVRNLVYNREARIDITGTYYYTDISGEEFTAFDRDTFGVIGPIQRTDIYGNLLFRDINNVNREVVKYGEPENVNNVYLYLDDESEFNGIINELQPQLEAFDIQFDNNGNQMYAIGTTIINGTYLSFDDGGNLVLFKFADGVFYDATIDINGTINIIGVFIGDPTELCPIITENNLNLSLNNTYIIYIRDKITNQQIYSKITDDIIVFTYNSVDWITFDNVTTIDFPIFLEYGKEFKGTESLVIVNNLIVDNNIVREQLIDENNRLLYLDFRNSQFAVKLECSYFFEDTGEPYDQNPETLIEKLIQNPVFDSGDEEGIVQTFNNIYPIECVEFFAKLYCDVTPEFLFSIISYLNINFNGLTDTTSVIKYLMQYLTDQSLAKDIYNNQLGKTTVEEKEHVIDQVNIIIIGLTDKIELLKSYFGENGTINVIINSSEFGNFAWNRRIGHFINETIDVEIGGQIIDKHTGNWLNIKYELEKDESQIRGYNKMIGDVEELYVYNNKVKPEYTLCVPLRFWFCSDNGNYVPLTALVHNEMVVNVKFRKLTDCAYFEKNTVFVNKKNNIIKETLPKLKCKLLAEYVYVEKRERQRIMKHKHEYLIEQVQYDEDNRLLKNENDIKLRFHSPSKYLIWMAQSDKMIDGSLTNGEKQWYNYTLTPYCYKKNKENKEKEILKVGNEILHYYDELSLFSKHTKQYDKIIKSAQLYIYGTSNTLAFTSDYFENVQPYSRNKHDVYQGINILSFALYMNSIQPSGSLNFSRIEDAFMRIIVNAENINDIDGDGTFDLLATEDQTRYYVYTVNYNILRIMSGMAGLGFQS
jgi:hypothetical protein